MPAQPCTAARPAAYTALLLSLSVLVSLLLPAGTAWASAPAGTPPLSSGTSERSDPRSPAARAGKAAQPRETPAARAPAPGECAALPPAAFGDPGAAVGTVTVPERGSACFAFTVERAGLHNAVYDANGGDTYTEFYDGERRLDCGSQCLLPRTGDFTLKVLNRSPEPRTVSVTVVPLGAATPGCLPPAGTAMGAPPLTGAVPGPLALVCQPFTGEPGDRIVHEFKTVRNANTFAWITDGTGAAVCPFGTGGRGCVLPGSGPYRIIARALSPEGGFPAAYTLRIQRLNEPEGCEPVPVNRYGSAPTAGDPAIGCKTFTVPATGHYSVNVIVDGNRSPRPVFDRAGKTVCQDWQYRCALTAGVEYVLHTTRPTLILDHASTAGCQPARLGVDKGSISAPGEMDCLTLPLPARARIALTLPGAGPDLDVSTRVVDADGKETCDLVGPENGTCELTGRTPFRVLVSYYTRDDEPGTGSYRFHLTRTDSPTGCRVLPAGDFTATSASARISTGGGAFAECLSIPASDHSTVEALQLRRLSGEPKKADVLVLDPQGGEVCDIDKRWDWFLSNCVLKKGTAYTVLFRGIDDPASYTLTRRDVTRTAKGCTAAPVVPVGGPSTIGRPGAPGTLICRQVITPESQDSLHLNVRDPLDTLGATVYDAWGGTACTATPCGTNGSTHYQVVMEVRSGHRAADSYRLDALRVGTRKGPVRECVQVPNVAFGLGPVTGTLDERRTAYCAVLPTGTGDSFDATVADGTDAAGTAALALYDANMRNECTDTGRPGGYRCHTNGSGPRTLVIGLAGTASKSSYRATLTCSYEPCGAESRRFDAVTPATGPTGPTGAGVTVKLLGKSLHEKDRILIESAGRSIESTTVSVAADRTSLTARLDLTTAAPERWRMSVVAYDGTRTPLGVFTVTHPAPVNTKAPSISGAVKVGAQLTARPGSWTPAPTSYRYQWKADGKDIAKATGPTYTVPANLLGRKVSVTVTALRAGHAVSKPATSSAAAVGKGGAPKATKVPVISGAAKVGRTLTAKPGTWTPAPTSYGYQWYAGGRAISGATKSTLTLKSAQRGKKITVKVTARRTGHADGSAVSAATVPVAR
ncbi:cell surface protein [Streptomyces yaizuensis]|uniref:Cell envelope integrity protein TolA n=1 Tax=Streptomyces yaizuensis TaxID=2989713 RepID=A0ABQ5NX63_9ACTN|nr:cell surface protein [Streptomyces sp. YSPA8]GLF94947.1 cell envelope integrity protein TolA [Streptomyces sp. YSPA8]